MRWVSFLLFCCALPASAQPVPDTTASWRYVPLAVGNAWEYDIFPNGWPDIDLGTRRVDIEKDTLVSGTSYFIRRSAFYDTDGMLSGGVQRSVVRFDTLTAMLQLLLNDGTSERPAFPCTFDAAFGDEVLCGQFGDDLYFTSGGYDEGTLTFSDTSLTVTHKGYASNLGFVTSYAADYGETITSGDLGDTWLLEYMRIDGVEYGTAQFPVASEEPIAEEDAPRVEVWPNPFRDRLSIALTVETSGPAILDVVDVLGRVVERRDLGVWVPGWREITLDAKRWSAGVYAVRLRVGDEQAVRFITRVR